MKKYDKFPAKVYVDTFLKPDLHIYKTVFKDALFQINYAQCIMLKEQKIISDGEAKIIFKNLNEIENEFDFENLEYNEKYEACSGTYNFAYVSNISLYRSEGFPRTGYFIPARLGGWGLDRFG